MALAGYCNQCNENVWLTDAGDCTRGHPASSVVDTYEASHPFTPLVISDEELAQSRKTVRLVAIMGAAVLILSLCAGVGLAWLALNGPLSVLGTRMNAEWRSRIADDYPGWKVVDFYSFKFEPTSGQPETDYVVKAIPAGQTFSIGVLYHEDERGQMVSNDDIFRRNAMFPERAPSLLTYVRANYIERGKTVIWVESDGDGPAFVNWEYADRKGSSTRQDGAVDSLEFDSITKTWSLEP